MDSVDGVSSGLQHQSTKKTKKCDRTQSSRYAGGSHEMVRHEIRRNLVESHQEGETPSVPIKKERKEIDHFFRLRISGTTNASNLFNFTNLSPKGVVLSSYKTFSFFRWIKLIITLVSASRHCFNSTFFSFCPLYFLLYIF